MTDAFDGIATARERIATELSEKTGFLDLSELGLETLPSELFELHHLRRLHLGNGLREEQGSWYRDHRPGVPNRLGKELEGLTAIPSLEMLSLRGLADIELSWLPALVRLSWLDVGFTGLTNLGPLAQLNALQSLECCFTQVVDLGPLAQLNALQSLDCRRTQVSDLGPLAQLNALQSLNCRTTRVSDLGPLAQLNALRSLDCNSTQVADLGPLAQLNALQSLNCSGTEVDDLDPLGQLSALQSLNCSNTQVDDLGPLVQLNALQSLNCSYTQVDDLGPLAQLNALQSLYCSDTPVEDLGPLAQLNALQSLDCSFTQVDDLGPLAQLSALQSLNCHRTKVANLRPLAQLNALQSLYCSETQVDDLGPLAQLHTLQSLDCSFTQVADLGPITLLPALSQLDCSACALGSLPTTLIFTPSLTDLRLHRATVPGIQPELLSQQFGENCLPALRASLHDAASGVTGVTDCKLLILGNGRAGKTQLRRKLQGEAFEERWDSTHGIRIAPAPLRQADGRERTLHIWDFGGQDIYHGTHALFVRSRAVFLLVWARDTESAADYEHQGISFRNHPLLYWVEYTSHLAEGASPVLIVQTKCDRSTDELPRAPVPDAALQTLGFRRELHISTKAAGRGLDELSASLNAAITWLEEQQGGATIPTNRLRLQRRLEALRRPDGSLPPEYRLLDQATFSAWCDEAAIVSAHDLVLAYLNNAGTLFYRQGLFGDRIVLDHAWALNAIYAVFDRTKCYPRLLREGGRFDRARLEDLIWREQGHSIADQRLFLTMMRSCGICFVYRASRKWAEDEDDDTIYIAPDLLPDQAALQAEIDAYWEVGGATHSLTFTYPLLHDGLMRSVIARIGDQAGLNALYWRGGICAYETSTHSRARIEQHLPPGDWRGTVGLQTRGGQARDLLDRLAAWISEENARLGLSPTLDQPVQPQHASPEPPTEFGPMPKTKPTYGVSYAWGDDTPEGLERERIVNRLCLEAEARGIQVVRDKTHMGMGDRISAFTRRLADCDRVLVILSEKYLHSVYCMTELYEVWLKCKSDDDAFIKKVRVFTLPDARIARLLERAAHAGWWQEQHAQIKALVDKHGQDFLSSSDYQEFRRMGHFIRQVPEILSLVQDTLRPTTFDHLVQHGFKDPPEPRTD